MTIDRVTETTAGAAITSPFWLDNLHSGAQWILPFLGIAWLVMQMYYKYKTERKKDKNGS